MTPRERVLACLRRETPDEVPMRDSPLKWTLQRWEREGMRPNGFPDDFMENCMDGSGFYDEKPQGIHTEIIEDREDHQIIRQEVCGTVSRAMHMIDRNSTAHIIEWPYKSRDDWERVKEKIVPGRARLNKKSIEWIKGVIKKGKAWTVACVTGPCGMGMEGIEDGIERTLLDPDWIAEKARFHAEFTVGMLKILREEGVLLDGVYINDDIAFRNGPLFSPQVFDDLFLAPMAQICDFVHGHGGHIFFHSDGQITKLIPGLIRAGIDILDPLEVQAGMDLATLKEQFGRQLVWEGNISAHALYYGTKEDIESEVKKKLAVFPQGGYIYRLDGPISEEASYDNYRWLIDCVKRYGKYK